MNTINRKIEISDELIEDILCTAFEGGITYWANNVSCHDNDDMKKVGGWKHKYLTGSKLKEAKLIIHSIDGGEVAMTKKSIIDALQKMDTPEYDCRKALDRLLDGGYDADDVDIVVQTACFGEVVYG